jgi:hypothetical protein
MNLGIGTEAAQFLFWEYSYSIFGTVCLVSVQIWIFTQTRTKCTATEN